MTARLFAPLQLPHLELANRIAIPSMGQTSARRGVAGPWHLQHYGSMAVSNPGLIVLESTCTEPRATGLGGTLSLYDDEHERAITKLVADIGTFSKSKFGVQLCHWGRKIRISDMPKVRAAAGVTDLEADGPSAIASGANFVIPAELDRAGMERVKRAFVESARRAARAGIQLIELHAAHGFLLNQFCSGLANTRTDEYGGAIEKRIRFPLEVAEAVRAVWPRDRALGFKINCLDFVSGETATEEAVALARGAKDIGLDYVCTSAGGVTEGIEVEAPKPGYLLQFASRVKREAEIAVMAVGLIVDPQQAEDVIADGHADFIAIGRGYIDDPRWAWHAAEVLNEQLDYPHAYTRVMPQRWPGTPAARMNFLAQAGGDGQRTASSW